MAPPSGRICPFNQQCLCSWRRHCSPRIPSVAPGTDYACLPAATDSSAAAACSQLLVGFISSSSSGTDDVLRMHRFGVTQSGRILGQSDDTLEVVDDVDYKTHEDTTTSTTIVCATAMPGSDGRSLCLFTEPMPIADDDDHDHIIRPLELHLNANDAAERRASITISTTFPDVPLGPEIMRTRPISAAGHLWAPCFFEDPDPPYLGHFLMKRLDKDAGKWEDVAGSMDLEITAEEQYWAGRFLHGYAVVKERTILLSLQQLGLFVAFDCSTGSWTQVLTTEDAMDWDNNRYLPIHERGVYVEEDDTIYFLSHTVLYAYKLCQDQDGLYRMAPPMEVDCLYPLDEAGCYGFVTHLGNRIMCSVWIGVSLRCSCDAKHVLITTFRVEGNNNNKGTSHGHFVPKGVKIIHSTCRRLDISPHKPSDSHGEFFYLQ
ncbi:hypothetical protein QOZ80_6AG0517210 [Eleusine coracana subsp. coracana]|nr:hypothetical protein QOZ80_6AG0517210 [Eleusine coracana subsp. coracana]